ncbi:vitamin K epoxide reductase family protein [Aquipuribacter hungaricus]|uniref:Vitamin K epoxide reductase family protein n=1 Tax=Aquipuribacter hungaricus TaxID=545624 RepID=A0ABV7WG52_9MICO
MAAPRTTDRPARLSPSDLSQYLRTGRDPDLRRRRAVVGLSLLGLAGGQVVAAFQTGLLRRLPDPPGPFDSDRVDSSDYAYRRLQTADGLLMLVSYAVTALLAGTGGPDRPSTRPLLPLLSAGKVAVDVVTRVVLAREEWRENRALCAYCQAATVASVVSLPLVLPEARRSLAALRARTTSS